MHSRAYERVGLSDNNGEERVGSLEMVLSHEDADEDDGDEESMNRSISRENGSHRGNDRFRIPLCDGRYVVPYLLISHLFSYRILTCRNPYPPQSSPYTRTYSCFLLLLSQRRV